MEAAEEEELKLQRDSSSLIAELKIRLGKSLWKTPSEGGHGRKNVHHKVRLRDLGQMVALVSLCWAIGNCSANLALR